ncbi:unnamed protein product [Prunus brigantina]
MDYQKARLDTGLITFSISWMYWWEKRWSETMSHSKCDIFLFCCRIWEIDKTTHQL